MKALDNSKSGGAVANQPNMPLRNVKKYYAGESSYMKRQLAKARRRLERQAAREHLEKEKQL